ELPPQQPPLPRLDYSMDFAARPLVSRIAPDLSSPATDLTAGPVAIKVGPYRIDELDEPPQVERRVQPRYPQAAFRLGLEGAFRVLFTVGADGALGDIEIVSRPEGSGELFDAEIRSAIGKWIIRPGRKEGRPVPTRVSNTFHFELD
ncbi:MAG: energy transducer TonB, partial [Planctomycetes bacterium]|nr:energy transducer TonB [Planctomycetota bacterium]